MDQHSSRLRQTDPLRKTQSLKGPQKSNSEIKKQLESLSMLIAASRAKVSNVHEELSNQVSERQGYSKEDIKSDKVIPNHNLDQSFHIVEKTKEKENRRRKFIYQAQSPNQEIDFQELQKYEQKNGRQVYKKSPMSDSTSTSASYKAFEKEKEYKIKISDFRLVKKLGQGKFGEVFIAQHKYTGFICALKRILKANVDEKGKIQIRRQIKIQSRLNHPNIVKLYAFFSDQKYIYMVQELCESGQLYIMLRTKGQVSEALTKVIIQQICRALDYMHECEIIHRDLKPENIIYSNGMVKICDFGWSISSKAMRETFCGTPLYVSPQLLQRKCYNNKIDVWSIGILTYQLLFGRVPFEITSQKDFIKIIQDEIKFSPKLSISKQAKDFIQCCLDKDPRDRYTVPELLEHPFITHIENANLAQLY